jgi:predicted transcriptional regulator
MPKGADDAGNLLGPLEAEVMKILWKAARPMTVRALLERINNRRDPQLAYTTVMTVMSRLVDKGVLARKREGRGYVYEAEVSDQAELAVRNVLREFGDSALAHFVDEARADPKTLARLQRLLSEDA